MMDKLVNVQPLAAPTGLIYYIRYKYKGKYKSVTKNKISKYRSIDEPDESDVSDVSDVFSWRDLQ